MIGSTVEVFGAGWLASGEVIAQAPTSLLVRYAAGETVVESWFVWEAGNAGRHGRRLGDSADIPHRLRVKAPAA